MGAELGIGAIVFACVFGGALGGMLIGTLLPEHHLRRETEDVVKLAAGVIATLSALVIGLLVASAKNSFNTKDSEFRQLAANLILLDRKLAHYGPETKDARDLLRRYTINEIDSTWPRDASRAVEHTSGWMQLEEIQDKVRALVPTSEAQRWLQGRALAISDDLAQTRWLLREQAGGSLPAPFLAMVVFWATAIFASFGLFAPRNRTVITALLVCSFSIAGSIFLILEMDRSSGGLIQISSAPVRDALARLGQ